MISMSSIKTSVFVRHLTDWGSASRIWRREIWPCHYESADPHNCWLVVWRLVHSSDQNTGLKADWQAGRWASRDGGWLTGVVVGLQFFTTRSIPSPKTSLQQPAFWLPCVLYHRGFSPLTSENLFSFARLDNDWSCVLSFPWFFFPIYLIFHQHQ